MSAHHPQVPAEAGAAPVPAGYGGFFRGGLALALPMVALREVLPCSALLPLPCPAACVVGGIDLRGVPVPVVDVCLLMSAAPAPARPGACVVIMVHEGRILGLLADGVTGVFQALPGSRAHASSPDPVAAVLAGSVRSADSGASLYLLCAAALSALHQVPMVQDPEPERVRPPDFNAVVVGLPGASARQLMLVRCGHTPLAIDALGVHATLAHTALRPSPLAMGHCRGVIEHGGRQVPAVDLLSLCGLGCIDASGASQAFVVRLDQGLVAFLVDEVLDVVSTQAAHVVPVPRFALPQPELFAGALPMSTLADEVARRTGTTAQQFLLMDAAALKAHPDVAGLAATNTGVAGLAATYTGAAGAMPGTPIEAKPHLVGSDALAAAPGEPQSMLTYDLAGEVATPIAQVAEILPYQPEGAVFAGAGALMGLVVNRGRSIPVLCLGALFGVPSPQPTAATSVLVVQSRGAHIGFAVPRLRSIEPAMWPAQRGAQARERAILGPVGARFSTRGLAQVGPSHAPRLLRVLDLQALALQVQGGLQGGLQECMRSDLPQDLLQGLSFGQSRSQSLGLQTTAQGGQPQAPAVSLPAEHAVA